MGKINNISIIYNENCEGRAKYTLLKKLEHTAQLQSKLLSQGKNRIHGCLIILTGAASQLLASQPTA